MRRLDESAEIVVFERSGYISYANCGLPYYIGGTIADKSALTLQTPESFRARFNVDMRTRHEVEAVDAKRHVVTVRNLDTDEVFEEPLRQAHPLARRATHPAEASRHGARPAFHPAHRRGHLRDEGLHRCGGPALGRGVRRRVHRPGSGREPARAGAGRDHRAAPAPPYEPLRRRCGRPHPPGDARSRRASGTGPFRGGIRRARRGHRRSLWPAKSRLRADMVVLAIGVTPVRPLRMRRGFKRASRAASS